MGLFNNEQRRRFHSLSVKDLLDAREAYYHHLMKLKNVVATAVGLYRIRYDDPSAESPDAKDFRKYGESGPRTLSNTVVKPWSWPCVLVFVKEYLSKDEMGKHPNDIIPRFLYLTDGRVVPTCVLYAEPDTRPDAVLATQLAFPSGLIGGGYPCFTDSSDTQGVEQVGTLGGLVTRAGTAYALTNHHVAGSHGRPVYRMNSSEKEQIGVSAPIHINKKKFSEVYPDWPGERTFVAMDAGLVRVDDVNQWTSQVYGIGEVGPLEDFNTDTITLDIIGTPVRAFCGISGTNEGEIYGLFYRYRSVGGFDYVADLLIGPRTDKYTAAQKDIRPSRREPRLNVQPGDSGSFVFIDPPQGPDDKNKAAEDKGGDRMARRLYPLGMLWGGVDIKDQNDSVPCVLATFLSTICRVLDVDIMNDHNLGYREYWGKTAHYKIGYAFCSILSNPALKKLVTANRDNIGFPNERLEMGRQFKVGRGQFVPLADVPDCVWIGKSMRDKKDGPRINEPTQHFADIDMEGPNGEASILELCRQDPDTYLSAQAWYDFYMLYDGLLYGPEMGALPFRVRQIYEDMVSYLTSGDLLRFVSAAGVLAHYVADGSISLHISELNHGFAPKARRGTPEFDAYKKTPEYKIHSIYEQTVLEDHTVEMNSMIDKNLKAVKAKPVVDNSFDALKHFFEMMSETYEIVNPMMIIEADDPSLKPKQRANLLFQELGSDMARCIALGCRTLAELVESAWKQGGGNALLKGGNPPVFDEVEVQDVYNSRDFLPALSFEKYIARGF